jgi:hypothetical protein
MPHLLGIEWIKQAFKEGASKLAHSKGFAYGKKYAALGGTASCRQKTFERRKKCLSNSFL